MNTRKHSLTIFRDPSDRDFYTAHYSDDGDNEAQHLAYKGTLSAAIAEALSVWGLFEDDVFIDASNGTGETQRDEWRRTNDAAWELVTKR